MYVDEEKGFGLPLKQWMRGPLKPLVDYSLQELSKRSEINGDTISLWIKAHERNSFPPSRIWHLVMLSYGFSNLSILALHMIIQDRNCFPIIFICMDWLV